MGANGNSMLYGLCSNTKVIPSVQITKNPFSALTSFSSFSFLAQSHKWVSLRVSPPISLWDSCPNQNIRPLRNRAVEVVGFSSGEDSSNGVKRKKLAVFVSGGGSNFRSIYEASVQGSIVGDFVVLVTNKPGFFLNTNLFLPIETM